MNSPVWVCVHLGAAMRVSVCSFSARAVSDVVWCISGWHCWELLEWKASQICGAVVQVQS